MILNKDIEQLLFEKIIHCHLAANDAVMDSACYAEGSDKGVDKCLSGLRLFLEDAHPSAKRLLIVFRDDIRTDRKLHFTKIDDSVGSVDEEVYLCAFFF